MSYTMFKPDASKSVAYQMLRDFYRAKAIYDHALTIQHARWWQRWGHRVLAGWRCPACAAYRRGEHKGYGLDSNQEAP